MECSTVYCDGDEYCIILNETRRKARKTHKCTECRREILRGEKYLDERILFEGTVETYKTCDDCKSIRDHFFTDGWMYGEIRYMLREHISYSEGDVSESCISGLTPGAQAVVCDLIEKCNREDEEDDE
jgi:hypothetical protein